MPFLVVFDDNARRSQIGVGGAPVVPQVSFAAARRECGASPSADRPAAHDATPSVVSERRPVALHLALPAVASCTRVIRHPAAGDGRAMASTRLSRLLTLAPVPLAGTTASRQGHSRPDPRDQPRQSVVGRTAYSR